MFQRFSFYIRRFQPSAQKAVLVTATAATCYYSLSHHVQPHNTVICSSDENTTTTTTITTTLLNWSGTHAVTTSQYWEPDTIEQVEAIVQDCQRQRKTIRPLGSALSPNAIGFASEGMLQMAGLDRIIRVDPERQQVTVQAGARVSQVIEALREHQLTLPNLASIAEQQMGGLIQVGAHGTGRTLAPLDAYVTELKLVTPAHPHAVTITREDPLFSWCTVGLGCLGVVVEITMQCVPAHELVEHTFVVSRKEAVERVQEWLQEHKHLRYMWIPYTDSVVVVTNNPREKWTEGQVPTPTVFSREEQFQPLLDLLHELDPDVDATGMGFGELRDALLAFDPLNLEHVQRCNRAEAEFWKRSQGYRIRPSDEVLQFDCGGQQWVWEVCFPTGTQEATNGNDMAYMQKLLQGIEEKLQIPAHAPIEQRWSASSPSKMSPAHGDANGLHSWVGIIAYLPSEDERQRRQITDVFTGTYCDWMRQVGQPFHAASHWAKLERPASMNRLIDLQLFMQQRFPLQEFNALRAKLDPHNILANSLLNLILGDPRNLD
ncbi:L-galactono-1,4-lactone dehydrogenase [Fistulifera solaris]|uniref:L-galactono-1,4-lactone dehydrogenase n=1 Tax=Fistulifera solaris TaxID=1519565 RepID=A0A1Z5JDX0_FISSO|nr:L-galactono-1,4-lactone dehydrogenase [Fistulifera solaris]|eukprot:GAX11978.1 L-galactono-1,4-lactone dehydrogenase [Fistulifera solaris]